MMACSSASSVSWRDRPAPPHPRAPPPPGRLTTGWALGHVIGAPPFDIGLLSHSLERRAPSMGVPCSLAQTGRGRARADEGHPAPGDGALVSWLDACLGLGPDPSPPFCLDLVDWTWEAETACLRPSQRRETGPRGGAHGPQSGPPGGPGSTLISRPRQMGGRGVGGSGGRRGPALGPPISRTSLPKFDKLTCPTAASSHPVRKAPDTTRPRARDWAL